MPDRKLWILVVGGDGEGAWYYPTKAALIDATKAAIWFDESPPSEEWQATIDQLETDGHINYEDGRVAWLEVESGIACTAGESVLCCEHTEAIEDLIGGSNADQ